jgi:hypothetical protein
MASHLRKQKSSDIIYPLDIHFKHVHLVRHGINPQQSLLNLVGYNLNLTTFVITTVLLFMTSVASTSFRIFVLYDKIEE